MNILEIIGVLSIGIITTRILYKIYRKRFGYNYDNCPCNHDTMVRYGATYCDKCKNKL